MSLVLETLRKTPTLFAPTAVQAKVVRDPRLDIVRGIALLIIYIAHVPSNWLWSVIPARFGLSDATDSFVFISGIASAIAFGGTFARNGFWTGTARIVFRCAQLWIAHLFLLFVIIAIAAIGSPLVGLDLVGPLQVAPILTAPADAIADAFRLHWIPASLDIMPVYITVLAMVPAVMALEKIHRLLPPVASFGLYGANAVLGLDPIAEAGTGRHWLLNPFAWQLIFFLGFAFKRGWLRVPKTRMIWTLLAWAWVAIGLAYRVIPEWVPGLHMLGDHLDKANLDVFRLGHFLATAYLLNSFLHTHPDIVASPFLRPFEQLGQQGLSVFVAGMIAANIAGIIVLLLGDGVLGQIAINLGGFVGLYGVAQAMAWYKAAPWRMKKAS